MPRFASAVTRCAIASVKAILLSGLTATVGLVASQATAQVGSGFTYQGVLKSAGSPYSGSADVRFRLFDAASRGNQIASTLDLLAVPIADGLFSATLDFGVIAFNGEDRWLEIAVSAPASGGTGTYITLTPRQRLAPVPYALQALNASISGDQPLAVNFNNAANGYLGASLNIGSGTLFAGSDSVGIGNATPLSLMHVGEGAGLEPYDGTTLTLESFSNHYLTMLASDSAESGLLFGRPSAAFPQAAGGIIFNNTSTPDGLEFRTGGANTTNLVITGSGNVGIGTTTPAAKLEVAGMVKANAYAMPPTTRTLTLTPSDFVPRQPSQPYVLSLSSLSIPSAASGDFFAPVHLPAGAIVTAFSIIAYDNSVPNNMLSSLYVMTLGMGSVDMAGMFTAGAEDAIRTFSDNTISTPIIDANKGYFVYVGWIENAPLSIALLGVQITYTITSTLP